MNTFSPRMARQIDLIALLSSRGVSAFASLAIIPLVLKSSGALAYGRFSLEYSGLLTVVALFGTVCTQPTYRTFDGVSSEEPTFVRFAALAAAGAGLTAVIFGATVKASIAETCLGAGMVFFQVLYTGLLTIKQIGAGARWYSFYEIVRGVAMLAPIALLFWARWPVNAAAAFALVAASFALGCSLVCRPQVFQAAWRNSAGLQPMGSGVAMGLWLAVSSFTFVGVKLLARRHAGATEFANFAVVLDVSSRMVGLIGSMVVVNYFPRLASAVREGSKRHVDVLILEGVGSHFALTLTAAAAIVGAVALLQRPDGILAPTAVVIYLGLVIFQTTPIAHKPLELAGRPVLLISILLFSQGLGFALMEGVVHHASIGVAAGCGIGAMGLLYSASVIAWWNCGDSGLAARKRLA